MTNNTIGWYSTEHAIKCGQRNVCYMQSGEYTNVSYLTNKEDDPHINHPYPDWKKIGPIRHVSHTEYYNGGKWLNGMFHHEKEKRSSNKMYSSIYCDK